MPPRVPSVTALAPPTPPPAAPATVASGPVVPAIDRIKLFDADEWEKFIVEWTASLENDYVEIGRMGGAGDQGRDVIAITANDEWDNYQCKHYWRPLMPSDVWIELGKLIHHVRSGSFTAPRAYYFVAPQGAGPALSNLLRSPDLLRKGLIEHWDDHCRDKITTTTAVELDQDLTDYISDFDFSIFGTVPPHVIVDGHATTRWHAVRFGGGLPARPTPPLPPAEPVPSEVRYVRALLDAYADHLTETVESVDDLPADSPLKEHYASARREFYSAEALRVFSRDTLPPDTFEELQDQVHSGVADDLSDDHESGYRCLRAVVGTARSLVLDGHVLNTSMTPRDRGGICHQLANDGTIPGWVK